MSALVVAVVNQKGGVGKTTVTVGVAERLTRSGHRVLLIDADPQGNATAAVGVDAPEFTLADVLVPDPRTGAVRPGVIQGAIVPAGEDWPRLDVVPADLNLAAREFDNVLGGEARLAEALTGVLDQFDVVLVDCPPSLGALTVNALTAAGAALLVTEPRAGSVDGLARVARTIATIRDHYNPGLAVLGVVINLWRADTDRTTWTNAIREDWPDLVIDPPIPEREVAAKATSAALPLATFPARQGAATLIEPLGVIAQRILDHTPALTKEAH